MPFYLIGSALIVMSLLYGLLPGEGKRNGNKSGESNVTPRPGPRQRISIRRLAGFFNLGEHAASAWGCILSSGFVMYAMLHIMIIHGGWLQAEYGLSPSRLGSVSLLLGAFDLAASIFVSVAVDRIGKRKSVLIGVAGMAASFILLPFLNLGLGPALAGLSISRCFFEFAVVSNLPLLSEQAPRHRGKVMSLGLTANLIGTTAAGLTGPAAYLKFGIWGLAPVSLAASTIALLLLIFVVRDQPYSTVEPPKN